MTALPKAAEIGLALAIVSKVRRQRGLKKWIIVYIVFSKGSFAVVVIANLFGTLPRRPVRYRAAAVFLSREGYD